MVGILSNLDGNGNFSNCFSCLPLLSFLESVQDLSISIQFKPLEKVSLWNDGIIHRGEALTKRHSVLHSRILGDGQGVDNPVYLWIPFPKPGHSQDDLLLSEI